MGLEDSKPNPNTSSMVLDATRKISSCGKASSLVWGQGAVLNDPSGKICGMLLGSLLPK